MFDFDAPRFVEGQIEAVRRALSGERALIAVSGGVDSTVSAIITHRAVGGNLACVFIDDNLMRLGEPEKVRAALSSPPLNLPVKVLDERKRFTEALKGLADAEEKRKAFREAFYEALGDAARAEGCRFLVQGTIKADVIETQGGIKTQHNVLDQIGIDPVDRFGFKVVEPIASLYKYEVREVARYLGAPPEISERQPFPGPGLSVRVVGEITEEKLEELKEATAVVEEAFKGSKPDQYFAAIFGGESASAPEDVAKAAAESLELQASNVKARFLREKGTGVTAGKRAYGSIVALDAVDESGRPLDVEYDALEKMRSSVQHGHPEITRVLFLLEKREGEGFIVALRAVKTRDFITASLAEIPSRILKKASEDIIEKCTKVSKVYLDITPKPPATIEFE